MTADIHVAAVLRGAASAGLNGEQVDLQLIFSPKDPLPTATRFVALYHHHKAGRTLHHHRDAFYRWNGSAYTEVAGTELRAQLYDMLSKASRAVGKGEFEPFQPTTSKVNDIVDALKAAVHLRGELAAPCWLDGRASPPATEVLACNNGLLHLPARRPLPGDPAVLRAARGRLRFRPARARAGPAGSSSSAPLARRPAAIDACRSASATC